MNDKYENVSTKVAAEVKSQLIHILKRMGLNEYKWLQLMIEVTIRMMDDRHNLSEAMANMIQMFRMVPGFKDAASLVDANAEAQIDGAIYFINVKGKKGYKPVMVERTWFDGEWNETHNVKDIVECVIERCAPDSYMKLRDHMMILECESVFECLMKMVDAYQLVRLDEEIPAMFNDMRAGNGRAIQYGNKAKGKQHRTPDSLARDLRIRFDDYDREVAGYEVEDWEGEVRQRDEPPANISDDDKT